MGRRRKKYTPPFEVEITSLGRGGAGIGEAPDGLPVQVKFAPPGSRLRVAPTQRKKLKGWKARRLEMLRPPPEMAEPPCPLFSLCGGCNLQELPLDVQRHHKWMYALRTVAESLGWSLEEMQERVKVHPVRGTQAAYRYRNKVEFSWGNRRILNQEEFEAGVTFNGRFLGFHAPGHFDRIADSQHCYLISEAGNVLLQVLREHTLHDDSPTVWDPKEHTGFWRHAMIRQGFSTGEFMVVLYTSPSQRPEEEQAVEQLAQALLATSLPDQTRVVGVVWVENDSVADVAQGEARQVWGQDEFEEKLRSISYRLSVRSFFQTSTEGAVILYDTIQEALQNSSSTLYDLYCGTGSIGLYVGKDFDKIVGIEEVPEAIEDARRNATANEITWATYHASALENALAHLPVHEERAALVVDPPRVGLHPKVAKALSKAYGDPLVYVACHPPSLGRDGAILREGGWELTDLWTVDLFPQTGHIELVGRFVKDT